MSIFLTYLRFLGF